MVELHPREVPFLSGQLELVARELDLLGPNVDILARQAALQPPLALAPFVAGHRLRDLAACRSCAREGRQRLGDAFAGTPEQSERDGRLERVADRACAKSESRQPLEVGGGAKGGEGGLLVPIESCVELLVVVVRLYLRALALERSQPNAGLRISDPEVLDRERRARYLEVVAGAERVVGCCIALLERR